MNKKIIAVLIALLPAVAFAHPGHSDGFIAEFVHSFTGIDHHLLMLLCVGILVGLIGAYARR
jgi:hydrogenase/urease accessory protein HupE